MVRDTILDLSKPVKYKQGSSRVRHLSPSARSYRALEVVAPPSNRKLVKHSILEPSLV